MIPLGAFELHSRLGQGGMGEVWRGVHRGQHVPVAVKLLTDELARKETFREAFRDEVRAVAGLEHHNIVMVFDYGTVPPETASASSGTLAEGTPWLAMELAEEGSFEAGAPIANWAELSAVLRALLAALAHAHARGVIHRDIKPANVLRSRQHTVKLTDFGLAHAMDRHDGEFTAGTPSYMAPEQFDGRWRDYGPWTDLYAVGCLTHALCSGQAPYGAQTDWAAARSLHNKADIPTLEASFPLPNGLQDWTRRLLSKDPSDRWRRCADALAALAELEASAPGLVAVPGIPSPLGSVLTRTRPGPTRTRAGTGPPPVPVTPVRPDVVPPARVVDLPATLGSLESEVPVATVVVKKASGDRPKIPDTWRTAELSARSPRLVGAGLGLFGLRTLAVVGRRAEQDQLWSALRAVSREKAARVVVLRGPSGCGKSRLAQWISERAHELGAASTLVARPVDGGGGDVLGAMILRWLRCAGLDRVDVYHRVAAQLIDVGVSDPRAWGQAMEVLWPVQGLAGLGARRRRGLVDLLRTLTVERPLVVWLDDAVRCPDAVEFCRDVLAAAAAPILLVLNVRDEEGGGADPAQLRSLLADSRAEACTLGALAEQDRAELVRHLLALDPALALEVERLSSGDPLFAVQLVGQWVHRDLLEAGRRGFRLKEGAKPEVPSDLRQIWAERVERFLADRPIDDAVALELAAVLGPDSCQSEWTLLCDRSSLEVSGGLVDALVACQLARPGVGGARLRWGFVHALVASVLQGRAEAADRLEGHHRLCASVLADGEERGQAERCARHWMAAGRTQRAIEPLLVAADERLLMGDHMRANELLLERDRAIDLDPRAVDARDVCEGWIRWGRLALRLGRLADAGAWAQRAWEMSHERRWGRVLVDSHLLLAVVARRQGRAAIASKHLFDAEQIAQADPTRWRWGLVRLEAARLHHQRRDWERAASELRQARSDFEFADDVLSVADVFYELARNAMGDGRPGAGRVLLDWARARYQWLACPLGVARCHLLDAELSRMQGQQERAAEQAHEAVRLFRQLGSAEFLHAELEVGRQALEQGDWERAGQRASRVARAWSIQQEMPSLGAAEDLLREVEKTRRKQAA